MVPRYLYRYYSGGTCTCTCTRQIPTNNGEDLFFYYYILLLEEVLSALEDITSDGRSHYGCEDVGELVECMFEDQ
jgi:hypothetical protein